MRLIITRHGETEENKLGIFQGHLPGHLSDLGITQAQKVALRLKGEKIDFIYSSDLDRAADTAKEIAKFHLDAPIKFVKELRERHFGEWQGRSKKELGFPKDTSQIRIIPKGGESSEEMHKRASDFLHKILLKHHNDIVLFVAHNGINKAIVAVITGKGPSDIRTIENLHNTSISEFEIDEDKNHKIHVFNCKKHLD